MTRTRKIVLSVTAVAGVIVLWLCWVILTEGLGVISRPAGSAANGNFKFRYWHTEGFGHSMTNTDLSYKGQSLAHRDLGGFIQDPHDPERALFERYSDPDEPKKPFGLFYFDGHTQRTYHISNNYKLSFVSLEAEFAEENHHPWSPDGRFVVIQDDEALQFFVINLETGRAVNAAEGVNGPLCGQRRDEHDLSTCRFLTFAGWSPDMSRGALLVTKPLDGTPVRQWESELYTFDPNTAELRYVCSTGIYGWDDERHAYQMSYAWAREGNGYGMQISFSPPRNQGCMAR